LRTGSCRTTAPRSCTGPAGRDRPSCRRPDREPPQRRRAARSWRYSRRSFRSAQARQTAVAVVSLLAVGVVKSPAYAEPTGQASPSTVRTREHVTVDVRGCDSSTATCP
jgi:hypothetical protein